MAFEKALNLPCPFAGQERADYVNEAPPGQTSSVPIPSSRSWTAMRRSSRSGVSRQRPSGLRRQVPLPEQGHRPGRRRPFRANRRARRVPWGVEQPRLNARSRALGARSSLDRRARLLSVARMLRSGAAAARASDLPPAPAHRSTISSCSSPVAGEGDSWLPSSWTSTRPALKAG